MGENRDTKDEFIREKIKDKPVNRKRLWYKIGTSAMCGLAFALIASVVFALVEPRIEARVASKATEGIKTEGEDTQNERVTEVTETPEVNYVPQPITMEDYQRIQTQLYSIGAMANRAIVAVQSVENTIDWFNNSFESEKIGSGVIVSDTASELLILVERNVIVDPEKITIGFEGGQTVKASLKCVDTNLGLALLSVEKEALDNTTKNRVVEAKLSALTSIPSGTTAIAIGNPLGASFSIVTGAVSSLNDSYSVADKNYGLIVTDMRCASNASGILINTKGEMIGLIKSELSVFNGRDTIVAINAAELKTAIDKMLAGTTIPYTGCMLTTVTDKISKAYDLPKGAFIKAVNMDSPAMTGGLQSGDVIVKVDDSTIYTANNYSDIVFASTSGRKLKVTVKRPTGDTYNEIVCEVTVGNQQ